jgi:formate dehydrogenase subunit delta
MKSEYLVKMANEIAAFYDGSDPDPATAVANHIKRYWEPRMISAFVAHLKAGGAGLTATALGAAGKLK